MESDKTDIFQECEEVKLLQRKRKDSLGLGATNIHLPFAGVNWKFVSIKSRKMNMMVVLYPKAAFNSGIITMYVYIKINYLYIFLFKGSMCHVYAYGSETVRVKHRFLLASMVRYWWSWVGVGWDDNVLCFCTHVDATPLWCCLHVHTWPMLRHGWGGAGWRMFIKI